MRWIWTVQRPDGTYDEVGMNNRGLINGNRNKAARVAVDLVAKRKRPVRMQGWGERDFYKSDTPSVEFVTEVGAPPVLVKPEEVTVLALFEAETALGENLTWLTDKLDLEVRQKDPDTLRRLAQLNAAWISLAKALATVKGAR